MSHALPAGMHAAPVTEAALPQLLAIEQRAFSHPWTLGHFTDSLRSGYRLQGLWQDDALLGYYVGMEGFEEAHLLNITVAPEWQGRGLARVLLDDLGDWARSRGALALWLEVRASNARAIQVYERWGFARVGLRKGYYPLTATRREDAVVMSRVLA